MNNQRNKDRERTCKNCGCELIPLFTSLYCGICEGSTDICDVWEAEKLGISLAEYIKRRQFKKATTPTPPKKTEIDFCLDEEIKNV